MRNYYREESKKDEPHTKNRWVVDLTVRLDDERYDEAFATSA